MVWYEVTGRGSGKKIDGLHVADVGQPYGKMITGCGVGVSAAFHVHHPWPWQRKCKMCRRVEKQSAST